MATVKKKPQRQCTGCGEMRDKSDLIRVIRTPEDKIEVDFTGKKMSAFWTFYDHDEKVDSDMRDCLKGANYVKGLPLPRSLTSDKAKTSEAMDQWIQTL